MLSELEGVQLTAQAEIDKQQAEYQQRLQLLSEEMVSCKLHSRSPINYKFDPASLKLAIFCCTAGYFQGL